ncbi:phosphatidylglycerophosphatase A family protein [Salinithrix halophila]|uniref:Phosphatidylglycerophosphatase A n=1 Tax=Salinithrix halophila TaxID=1485204 RepID=A0ABV8JJH7_9BACL
MISDNTKDITDDIIHRTTLAWLQERGVELADVAVLVHYLQHSYYPDITLDECQKHVEHVLTKREVQNAILTGIQLDKLAERNQIEEPLVSMLCQDDSLYGIDEVMATSILNLYGSIGMTNYGYIDRVKPHILGRLNNHENGQVHTFLDDMVGALASAAAARLSHNRKQTKDHQRQEMVIPRQDPRNHPPV